MADLGFEIGFNDSKTGLPNENNNGTVTNNLHRRSYHEHQDDDRVRHGSVVLGKDAGRGNVYYTRYHIHQKGQRSELCSEVLEEEFVPCCGEKARRHCGYMIWAFIRSEAFLFTLHMTAVALGAVKEAANYRESEEGEAMHLVHSIIETLVSVLVITVRVASAWTSFYHIKKGVTRYQKLPDKSTHNKKHHVQGEALKRYLLALTGIGILLIIFLVATCVMFYFLAHLGWTILTNQFALVAIMMLSGLYMARVVSTETKIEADQHKAVLYEANLLLQENYVASTQPELVQQLRNSILSQTERFCKAFKDTELFVQPEYIQIDEQYKPVQSLTLNFVMQSVAL